MLIGIRVRTMSRTFTRFYHKGAAYRIYTSGGVESRDAVESSIIRERQALERYIEIRPEFLTSFAPIPDDPSAPPIARSMLDAAARSGVGPMAAVAGAIAERACRAGCERKCGSGKSRREVIVENGGDIYLITDTPITVALHSSEESSLPLAFRITPAETPLAVCSSSSRMGHSTSFGTCDLATVVSVNGALADAVATLSCNLIRSVDDIDGVLKKVTALAGIQGVFIVRDGHIGMAGALPEVIRAKDPDISDKITRSDARLTSLS